MYLLTKIIYCMNIILLSRSIEWGGHPGFCEYFLTCEG